MPQQLPRELYHAILEYLPLECLFQSADFVCHEFYNIIHCDATFQKDLYLNNFSRDFVSVRGYCFDEKRMSGVISVELKSPKGEVVDICVMNELKLIKDPYNWENIVSYGLERPLILMRVYSDGTELIKLKDKLVDEIFKQSCEKECTVLFCEMCKLYEHVEHNFLKGNNFNIFTLRKRDTLLMKMAYSNCEQNFIWMCENLNPPSSQNNNHLLAVNNTYGQNCLHIACGRGSINIVKYLVEKKGMDVNIVDTDGYTCLHLAASKTNVELCKYLLKHRANKYNFTLNGFRPFHLVRNNTELQKLLSVQPVTN